jgi:RNA recognition motif 2
MYQDRQLDSVVSVRRVALNRYILRFDGINQAKVAHDHIVRTAIGKQTGWVVQYVTPATFNMARGFESPNAAAFEADVVVVVSAVGDGNLPCDVKYARTLYATIRGRVQADFGGSCVVRQLVADCYQDGKIAFRFEMESVSGADTMLRGWNKGVLVTVASAMSQVSVVLFHVVASHRLQVRMTAHYYETAQDPNMNLGPRRLYVPQGSTDKKGNNIVPGDIVGNKECRTTVMLRNIPNKLQSFEMKRILDAILHGRYDLLYVRTDFGNLCNVGYAFVNFVDTKDVLVFYNAIHGRSWNVHNSDKVAALCYAQIQGTDRLVEKFRNSGVQAQWAPFRAKLFFASGDRSVDASKWGTEAQFPEVNNRVKVRYLFFFLLIGF